MDGYQVARKLREQPCCQPVLIVALSGYAIKKEGFGADTAGF
jgi:CheY-like chemotaxis protein